MYYGYHQRIRQRIEAGELSGAYETDDYSVPTGGRSTGRCWTAWGFRS